VAATTPLFFQAEFAPLPREQFAGPAALADAELGRRPAST